MPSDVSIEHLHTTIEIACTEYSEYTSKYAKNSIFNVHGNLGRERAREITNALKAINTPDTLLLDIKQYLLYGKGNLNTHSFKSYLYRKLALLFEVDKIAAKSVRKRHIAYLFNAINSAKVTTSNSPLVEQGLV